MWFSGFVLDPVTHSWGVPMINIRLLNVLQVGKPAVYQILVLPTKYAAALFFSTTISELRISLQAFRINSDKKKKQQMYENAFISLGVKFNCPLTELQSRVLLFSTLSHTSRWNSDLKWSYWFNSTKEAQKTFISLFSCFTRLMT